MQVAYLEITADVRLQNNYLVEVKKRNSELSSIEPTSS